MLGFNNLIRLIFDKYDLGSPKDFVVVKGGYINNNFKVVTDSGTYFLRGFSDIMDCDKVNHLNNFLVKLNDSGFPVPSPFLTKNKNYCISLDSKLYAIYEFIEGESYNFSNEHLLESARTLARFHEAVVNIDVDIYKTLTFDPSFFKELYVDEKFLVKDKLETDFEDKDFLTYSLSFYKQNISLLEREFASLPKRNDFNIVHGDYWFGQLIFKNNKVVALVDFDEIKKGLFEFDLVKGVRSFARYRDREGYDFVKMKLFLEEYKKIQPNITLTEVEIIFYLRYSLLSIFKFHIYDAVAKSFSEEKKHAIRYHLKELTWIRDSEAEILKSFSDIFNEGWIC